MQVVRITSADGGFNARLKVATSLRTATLAGAHSVHAAPALGPGDYLSCNAHYAPSSEIAGLNQAVDALQQAGVLSSRYGLAGHRSGRHGLFVNIALRIWSANRH